MKNRNRSNQNRTSRTRNSSAASTINAPVQQLDVIELDITGQGHDGEGVGRYEGFTIFTPGAIKGERTRVEITHVTKRFAHARLLEIIEAAPSRVQPLCPIFDRCGGCQLQHMSYESQLEHKRQVVIDALTRIGKLQVAETSNSDAPGIIVHPTIGMEDPWGYRNKAQIPVGLYQGRIVAGFFAAGSHDIVEMNGCAIQHPYTDDIIQVVKEILTELDIAPYNEITHTGLIRHVVSKVAFSTSQTMIVLVTNGADIPQQNELIDRLRTRIPHVVSIIQNINTAITNVIFGRDTRVLWGKETIEDRIGDIRFAISARSFYQVNPVQTRVLYEKALDYAQLNGTETVIDAYCGIGTISLFLAQQARHVIGVEIVPEAIEDAKKNAALNGITNAEFLVGEAERIIPRLYSEKGQRADTIVVDPPRKGCDEALLQTIVDMRPERVVYISCNPSTLARDLKFLEEGGYRTVEMQPVDMFPHTGHVECVIGMQRIDT